MLTSGDRRTAHFRAHERRRVQLDALLFRQGGGEPLSARVVNLGLGGAGLTCAATLRTEERITVTLLSPTLLDPLVATARVAWARQGGDAPEGSSELHAGVAFEALEREALLTLFQLISNVSA